MRVTWIGGWGVAPESLRPVAEKYFTHSQHTILAPTADAVARSAANLNGALSKAAAPDLLVGWSLGAWRVIDAAAHGVQFSGMVLLLAPFVAFPSEAGLGGKCSVTQVKFLRRRLQREPLAALADFCQRAGLGAPPTELPYAMPDLLEGLDQLSADAPPALREFAARGLPRNWQALAGDSDPLLDGAAVCRAFSGCALLRGAGHAIADLLAASQAK